MWRASISTPDLVAAPLCGSDREAFFISSKIPDYATHHLFDASNAFIFARMFLFVLLYHAIPLGGTVFIMTLNQMATPINILVITLVVLAILFTITSVVHKRFCVQFSPMITFTPF